MSADRFIYFEKGKVPSKDEVKFALEDYLGQFMVSNEWAGGRWNVTLVGNNSWPFRRLIKQGTLPAAAEEESKEVRWMEVYIDRDYIDVITRRGDWATNTLASGFAQVVAQYWDGRLEEE